MELANSTTSIVRLCQKITSNLYDIGFHKLPTCWNSVRIIYVLLIYKIYECN